MGVVGNNVKGQHVLTDMVAIESQYHLAASYRIRLNSCKQKATRRAKF